MPRTPRRPAESDIYHVVIRGVGRQIIFEDDADRRCFLAVLREEMGDREGALLAWCLMDNHVHLLMRMALAELSDLMRVLDSTYALIFNKRHDRTGHLFQDRFMSEPVESDSYLLTVVRYIHRNPVEAGMSRGCDYRWSSYRAYLGGSDESGVTSCELVLEMFGSDESFVRFHDAPGGPRCLDLGDATRPTSSEAARSVAARALGDLRVEEISALPRPQRNAAIRTLRSAQLSVRQIERLTGVSRGVIARL